MSDLNEYIREFDSIIQDIYNKHRTGMDKEVEDVFQKFMNIDDVDKEDLKEKLTKSVAYIRNKYVCDDFGNTFDLNGGRRRTNKHNKRRNKRKKYSRRR